VLRVVGTWDRADQRYHVYVTSLPAEAFSVDEIAVLYSRRWEIELLFKLLKSSCHLDHVDTGDADALRTHIYASLLASVVLSSLAEAAAEAHGLEPGEISPLMTGIAAPLIALPLLMLMSGHMVGRRELMACVLRTVAHGCRDKNPRRTARKWGRMGKR
jgi:hypothetical protein